MHEFEQYINPFLGKMLRKLRMDKRFVRGKGCYLYDDQGREYLDFIAAYGALPFGYNPEEIWGALESVRATGEPSFAQPSSPDAAGQLARRLVELAPNGIEYVTFTNSGAEAAEAAVKMTRAATSRPGILATHNSFHGKTMGALSMTGRPEYQEVFGVPFVGFDHIPFGDAEALESVLARAPDSYAAFILEPIQGEGGIIMPPLGYLKRVREICDQYGVLLIFDEIQTGLGRTGAMFAADHEKVTPDIILLAKALGGGLFPIGAVLSTDDAYTEDFGMKHSSTFAGSSPACRVGLAALEMLTRDRGALLDEVTRKGDRLKGELEALSREHPDIVSVRGKGLMLGLDFQLDRDTFPRSLLGVMAEQELLTPVLSSYLLNVEHLRVAPTLNGKSTIRIEPPLVISDSQCDMALERLERTVKALSSGNTAYLLRHLGDVPAKRFALETSTRESPRPAPIRREDEGRFAFLVHPVDLSNYSDFDKSLSVFSEGELAKLAASWNDLVDPFVLSSATIESRTGETAFGEFIAIPRTAEDMVDMPRDEALAEVGSAIELAKSRGAKIVGLGAYTAVVTYGGLRAQNLGVPVTTGNSYTVVSAVDAMNYALKQLGERPEYSTGAVVGAGGAIGKGSAILMSESVKRLLLIGNPANPERSLKRLLGVAQDIVRHLVKQAEAGRDFVPDTLGQAVMDALPPDPADEEAFAEFVQEFASRQDYLVLDTRLDEMISEADMAITATSNLEELITSDMVKHGAVICDISRPPNVSREIHRTRDDVLVIDGGVIALPGQPDLGWNFGFEKGMAYACMAETMMLALEKRYEHASIGSNLELDFILHTRELADKHGFSLAELRSFDRPLGDQEWNRIVRARAVT